MDGRAFRLIDRGWSTEIEQALRRDRGEICLISPFIKLATARRFLRRACALRLVTRFNLNDAYQGVTDLEALIEIIDAGGEVRGLRGLHSKMFLFGTGTAIAGSANMSEAGLLRNHEFGFVSSDLAIVAQCRQYFDKLWQAAEPSVTVAKLNDWRKQVAVERSKARGVEPKLRDYGAKANLGADSSPFVDPQSSPAAPDDRQYFVKFFGTGDNRADPDESVAYHVMRGGCHWACTYGKRPRNVEDGDRMFLARLTKRPNDIRIFGQAIAQRHRDGVDDASEDDIRARDWKIDWPYYVRVHDAQFLDGKLSDGVSLNELMERFGQDAFASTQRNARRGEGNRDPRRSLSQQPQVKLTTEAAGWLAARLEFTFRQVGTLDLSSSDYDWPAA